MCSIDTLRKSTSTLSPPVNDVVLEIHRRRWRAHQRGVGRTHPRDPEHAVVRAQPRGVDSALTPSASNGRAVEQHEQLL